MSGLFGTLNIGKSGLFAQQGAINVTGHNIANGNTEGYSRQRVELQTTRPYCKPSMNSTAGPGQIGTGVQIAAINRVRDSFLDYQTRVEYGVQGQFESRNKFLSQIENILNEPTDVGISNLVEKFFHSWQDLSLHSETSNARSVVIEQSKALTDELNHTYNELKQLKTNTQMEINNTVFEVNNILNQVNQLNQEIIQVKIAHQQPNDLMDRRDLLLDKLSSKFGIEIKKENFDGIDLTTSNHAKDYQKRTSELGGESPKVAKGSSLNLVQTINPDDTCRFSYITEIKETAKTGTYEITYYKDGDTKSDANKKTIKINMSKEEYKKLDECRVLWTYKGDVVVHEKNTNKNITNSQEKTLQNKEKIYVTKENGEYNYENLKCFEPPSGELRGLMSVQQDIDNYQDELNKLAKGLAFSVNAIHMQDDGNGNGLKDGKAFFINGKKHKDNPKAKLTDDEITAENITINEELLKDPMKIITGVTEKSSAEGDGKRALAIGQLRDTLMGIQSIENTTTRKSFLKDHFKENESLGKIFTITKNTNGKTLDSHFNDVVGGLGVDEQEARRMVKNQGVLLAGFKQARDSVSGVSLDEEFANIVQYSHCYQANAKIISTVDQLLDVVINGLKR
ncbi:flagellar hook-associated protein FlgK [Clostridium niameyense]|uniref:Flagellar hook-associated protein 1 n=1 Tax=Clostridium niameyense TaxID=1622073 RepID=A0A6M0R6J6_9CLOT|nr:flagellar hook-associated protein FlgK [Clostridium niameyense]NEZ45862.1 flagellar hook-associated protein FlgK [Clostridium niameyense]